MTHVTNLNFDEAIFSLLHMFETMGGAEQKSDLPHSSPNPCCARGVAVRREWRSLGWPVPCGCSPNNRG